MNQCVPSWGFEDDPNSPMLNTFRLHSYSASSTLDVPTLDYEIAELTWRHGQISMQGLGLPRAQNKPQPTTSPPKYTWEKPRAGGTLEAIVNQATLLPTSKITDDVDHCGDELVLWLNYHQHKAPAAAAVPVSASASATITMDALVPCANTVTNNEPMMVSGNGTCVGSCTGAGDTKCEKERVVRVRGRGAHEWSSRDHSSGSGSATFGREKEFSAPGFMSTSIGSQGNTSSGKDGVKSTTGEEHDSVCHSRPPREAGDHEEDKRRKGKGKSTLSTKRSRAAAVHNQSERKRRDRINQRMKTLQKLVPNSSKTDKASMLDEVIEYLKQLQAQIHMMSRVSPLMLPLAMQQQLQMSMMNPMGLAMGMGMGPVMDFNSLAGRPNNLGMPHVLHPSAFIPLANSWEVAAASAGDRVPAPTALMPDPMSAFLACQSQPMTMDAYSRMAGLFQQMHEQQQSQGNGAKN